MDYIIYTTDGCEESPNGTEVNNCQIIDFLYNENNNKDSAFKSFLNRENQNLNKLGFDENKLKIITCINDKELSALEDIISYFWEQEKNNFEKCPNKESAENHIFNKLQILANYLNSSKEKR